jgi:hypothetical protein
MTTIESTGKPQANDPSVSMLSAVVTEGTDTSYSAVRFEFVTKDPSARERIQGLYHLFTEMRKALERETQNDSWSIRYASRVLKENVPFLHSANTLQVVIDPLLPYRDPIRDLLHSGYLEFQISDSQAYYFKAKADASRIIEEEKRLRNREVSSRSSDMPAH